MKYSRDRQHKIRELYTHGGSIRTVAKAVHIDIKAVPKILRELGVPIRAPGGQRRCHVDESFFETIDTEAKAYWVGFLLADGCVYDKEGTRAVALNIHSRDRAHVEKFRNALSSEHAIVRNGPCVFFRVRSNKLCNDLIKIGVTPRKSLTAKPAIVPTHLRRHYMRGLFDGDGCIAQPSGRRGFRVCLCGTYRVVSDFRSWAGVKTKICKKERIWSLQTAEQNKVISILEEMYEGASIYLDRKYKLYKDAASSYYSVPHKHRFRDPATRYFAWIDQPKQLRLPLYQ